MRNNWSWVWARIELSLQNDTMTLHMAAMQLLHVLFLSKQFSAEWVLHPQWNLKPTLTVTGGNKYPCDESAPRQMWTHVTGESPSSASSSTNATKTTSSWQLAQTEQKCCANLVSTFCYLSLEGELGEFLHGRRGDGFLRGHPHPAEDDDNHSQDEEHTAGHVDQDVGVLVFQLGARNFEEKMWNFFRRQKWNSLIFVKGVTGMLWSAAQIL